MTGDQRQLWALKFALNHVQIGSTDPAHADFNEHLAGSRLGWRNVAKDEGIGGHVADVAKNHCPHDDK
jgi:hypothetical protein